MNALQYFHQKGIYYGDMKPQNLLVFRDQRVKLGDLGISIKFDFHDKNGTGNLYQIKGMSPGYYAEEIGDAFKNGERLNKKQLLSNDIYALKITFNKILDQLQE